MKCEERLRSPFCPTMEDQRICIFGGFRVIVSINIFVHALSPDNARRAYLQCFYVFLLCQMNVSNTLPYKQRNKNAFYSKLRKKQIRRFSFVRQHWAVAVLQLLACGKSSPLTDHSPCGLTTKQREACEGWVIANGHAVLDPPLVGLQQSNEKHVRDG